MLYIFLGWNVALFVAMTVPLAVLYWSTDPSFVLKAAAVFHATSSLVPPIVLLLHGWDRTKARLGIGETASTLIVVVLAIGLIVVSRRGQTKIQNTLNGLDKMTQSWRQDTMLIMQAVRAQGALLALMRAEPSVFEGVDPERFATVEMKAIGNGRFSWGAFTIDVGQKTYSATVASEAAFWSYRGRFIVTAAGEWQAENVEKLHATAPPK